MLWHQDEEQYRSLLQEYLLCTYIDGSGRMQLAALGRTSHEAILPLGFAARQENTFIRRSQFIRRHVQAQRDVGFITRVPYPVLLYPQPIITQETGGPGSQCGAQNTIEVPGSSLGSRPCSLALAPSPTLTLTPSPALPRSRAPALPHPHSLTLASEASSWQCSDPGHSNASSGKR